MALPTGYKNPQDLAKELKNPMTAIEMAEKAKDLARVLEKGMNIHLMTPAGRITVSHTAEELKTAYEARETMRNLTGGEHVADNLTSQRVPDGRIPDTQTITRGA